MYIAAVAFADLSDGRHLYQAGDEFPRKGLTVSDTRIAELAGSDNRMGYPLIKAVEAPEKPVKKRAGRKRAVNADD